MTVLANGRIRHGVVARCCDRINEDNKNGKQLLHSVRYAFSFYCM